jgi:hypothetical protein
MPPSADWTDPLNQVRHRAENVRVIADHESFVLERNRQMGQPAQELIKLFARDRESLRTAVQSSGRTSGILNQKS